MKGRPISAPPPVGRPTKGRRPQRAAQRWAGADLIRLAIETTLTGLLVWATFQQAKIADSLRKLEHARSAPGFSIVETRATEPIRGSVRDVESLSITPNSGVKYIERIDPIQLVVLRAIVNGVPQECGTVVDNYFDGAGTIIRTSGRAKLLLRIAAESNPNMGMDFIPTTTLFEITYVDIFNQRQKAKIWYRDGQVTPLATSDEEGLHSQSPRLHLDRPVRGHFGIRVVPAAQPPGLSTCGPIIEKWRELARSVRSEDLQRHLKAIPGGW